MRLAIFSDVHGNLAALEAVLSDISGLGVDGLLFAGDLCLVGPRPAECLERVKDIACPAVFGNTDEWLLNRQQAPDHLNNLATWTQAQLDEEQRTWLGELPFAHRVSPTDRPSNDLFIVHANPQDVNQLVFPPEDEQMIRYGRIRQSDSDLDIIFQDTESAIVAFGHLHIPFERNLDQIRLVNISSVSMPGDDDPRAKYGMFTWEGNKWTFERRKVAYDTAPEIMAYRQNKPPGWQNFVEQLTTEGFVAQRV